jgi:hypothetical protein
VFPSDAELESQFIGGTFTTWDGGGQFDA